MAKKGQGFHGSPKKSHRSGPLKTSGSGISQSSIPRAGYPPGGRSHATRYDAHIDSHSVDKHTGKG